MSQGTNLRDYLAAQPPEFQEGVARRAERIIQQIADRQSIQALISSGRAEADRDRPLEPKVSARSMARAGRALRALREFAAEIGGEVDVAVRFPDPSPTRRETAVPIAEAGLSADS